MPVRSYRDLVAWQKAMDFVVKVYRATQKFPREELYGLTNQLRRAAVSVAANIAEGQGRGVGKEFIHHLRIARGSLQEAETHILIAEQLHFAEPTVLTRLLAMADELSRVNRGLHNSQLATRNS